VRNGVKHSEIDSGKPPGVTTVEQQRIAELERENRELRSANGSGEPLEGRTAHCGGSRKTASFPVAARLASPAPVQTRR
jgi:hypothetical protein